MLLYGGVKKYFKNLQQTYHWAGTHKTVEREDDILAFLLALNVVKKQIVFQNRKK